MEKKYQRTPSDTRDSLNVFSDPHRRSSGSQESESFIFLILDCFSYTAGEKVTGEVLLNVSEPIPKSTMKFQSRGIEEVHIFSSKDKSRIIAEDIKEIFILDEVVKTWEDEISIGQYVFPFNFKIPNFSPATFYYSGEDISGNYVRAEVFYHVSVKLLIDGDESKLSHSRIVCIKNMQTLEKPGPSIEAIANITGCCFSKKGTTSFKLAVGNTDHCQVEGQVHYKLCPNNEYCKSPINYVVGQVLLDITVRTRHGDFKILKTISETERATWISAFTSLVYERDFEYNADLKVSSEELNPSSNEGSLIKCEYYVEMLVYYDISFKKNPVVIKLPFHVNPKITYRKEEPKLPVLWEPEESSIYNFIVEVREIIREGYANIMDVAVPTKIN